LSILVASRWQELPGRERKQEQVNEHEFEAYYQPEELAAAPSTWHSAQQLRRCHGLIKLPSGGVKMYVLKAIRNLSLHHQPGARLPV